MRTKVSTRFLIVLATAALLVASCTKDQPSPAVKPNGTTDPSVYGLVGSIVDMGDMNSNSRLMEMTLNYQQDVYDSVSGNILGKGNSIVIKFYVNEDGRVPSGSYSFSNSDPKVPFTFASAVISLTNSAGAQVYEEAIDGQVVVNNSNNQYDVNYTFNLYGGVVVNGRAIGSLSYMDSDMVYNYRK